MEHKKIIPSSDYCLETKAFYNPKMSYFSIKITKGFNACCLYIRLHGQFHRQRQCDLFISCGKTTYNKRRIRRMDKDSFFLKYPFGAMFLFKKGSIHIIKFTSSFNDFLLN